MSKHEEKKIKFLILGADGLIGSAVVDEIQGEYEWVGTSIKEGQDCFRVLDITQKESILKIFKEVAPTHVVHCANLSGGVRLAQEQPERARRFHYDATVDIAQECQKRNARLIFISSECVFDGSKEAYREEDEVNPINVYGKCKAQSEEWIAKHCADYATVRTMSVFGWQPETTTPNAVMSVYFALSQNRQIPVSTSRWGTPTYVKDLAKALIEIGLAKDQGIFHVAGGSYLSRYDWLKRTCEVLGWDSSFLCGRQEDYSKEVAYPQRVRLNTEKFCQIFKTELHSIDEALELLKEDVRKTG